MNGEKINTDQLETSLKPNVLVAPLDWGLGHTTRCIPLIRCLAHSGCRVLLAGDKNTKAILLAEFPELEFFELKGYQVRYTKSKSGLGLRLALVQQIPKILRAIKHEHQWLNKAIDDLKLDAVISDNRYGLHSKRISCILLTHQLDIRTPWQKFLGKWLRQWHYAYLNRFDKCWVPDYEGSNNLSGLLSHPSALPEIPLTYLGPLTRFQHRDNKKERHLLVIISGPEPQRTLFENTVLEDLKKYEGPAIVIRGLPSAKEMPALPFHIKGYNHLSSNEMSKVIKDAQLVISRSGYSTVMDLAVFAKKAVFVPTPGQTEQDYLAKHLSKMNFAPYLRQNEFTLMKAFELSKTFSYKLERFATAGLEQKISQWVTGLHKQKRTS